MIKGITADCHCIVLYIVNTFPFVIFQNVKHFAMHIICIGFTFIRLDERNAGKLLPHVLLFAKPEFFFCCCCSFRKHKIRIKSQKLSSRNEKAVLHEQYKTQNNGWEKERNEKQQKYIETNL